MKPFEALNTEALNTIEAEESYEEKVKGIHLSLNYLSRICKSIGLDFTSHMASAAALSALVEMSNPKNESQQPPSSKSGALR